MKVKKILPSIVFAIGVWTLTPQAYADPADPLIEGAKLCTHLLPKFEKEYGIPKHLLSAIATTESGRYHDGLKISVPWPWTINAAGKGYFFDNKQDAVAAVEKFRKKGVQSIDVGCMQVNLFHHAQAFSSLEEAFEPKNNIAYAASFLKNLHQEKGSWKQAAADYHSKTPVRGNQYIGKVYSSWKLLVDKLRLAQLKIPENALVELKKMKPAARDKGVQYASLSPSAAAPMPVKKVAPLPEQVGKKVDAYRSPHMNAVALSNKNTRRENGVLIMRPEIQSAAAMPTIADTTIFRLDNRPEIRPSAPNFIFND